MDSPPWTVFILVPFLVLVVVSPHLLWTFASYLDRIGTQAAHPLSRAFALSLLGMWVALLILGKLTGWSER